MSNNTTSPIQAMFELQRDSIKQGQKTFEQGLELQKNVTETIVKNGFNTQKSLQHQGTQVARQSVDAYFNALQSMFEEGEGQDVRRTIEQQFEEFTDAQNQAWDSFEQSLDESIRAYENLTESQKNLVDRSVNSFFRVQQQAENQTTEAAQRIEQQARETTGSESGSK